MSIGSLPDLGINSLLDSDDVAIKAVKESIKHLNHAIEYAASKGIHTKIVAVDSENADISPTILVSATLFKVL